MIQRAECYILLSSLRLLLLPGTLLASPNCGFHTVIGNGTISTPNFPKPYPVPINCQWIVEAPPTMKIAVYFTQFYMKSGLRAIEFDHYNRDLKMEIGRFDFGIISSTHEPTYLITNKRFLVLDMRIRTLENVHLRVREHLMDAFGFNITYEMIPKKQRVRKDPCIYHHCSFTGYCYASSNFEAYNCHCFEGYFGKECQYDNYCGPTSKQKICFNGGTCRYYIGSSVRTCECPNGYEGVKCEKKIANNTEVIHNPNFNPKCEENLYASMPGYITIYPRSRKCHQTGNVRYIIKMQFNVTDDLSMHLKNSDLKRNLQNLLRRKLTASYFGISNVTVVSIREDGFIEAHFLAENPDGIGDMADVEDKLEHLQDDDFPFEIQKLYIETQPALTIQRIEISESMPILEGHPLLLACIVRGDPSTKIEWLKDGFPIVFLVTHERIWNIAIPQNSAGQHTSLLGFDTIHPLDSGTFSCSARDNQGEEKVSVSVTVRTISQPLISPLSATLLAGSTVNITCMSKEDIFENFRYTWLKDNRHIQKERDMEVVEDLFPTGTRIILEKALTSANYTCIVHAPSVSKRDTSYITVLNAKEMSSSTCSAENSHGIHWKITASGARDIQNCPSGYTGYVHRYCIVGSDHSNAWERPDFSRCFSPPILAVKKQFDSRKFGYRSRTVNFLLRKLWNFLSLKHLIIHPSEGEPIVDILFEADVDSFIENHAELNWILVLKISSVLLNRTLVQKNYENVKLHHVIKNLTLEYGQASLPEPYSANYFSSNRLCVEVLKISSTLPKILHFPLERDNDTSSCFSFIDYDLTLWKKHDFNGSSSITIMSVLYKNFPFSSTEGIISNYRKVKFSFRTPAVFVDFSAHDKDDISVKAKIIFNNPPKKENAENDFTCVKILFVKRNMELKYCYIVSKSLNNVVCECFGVGYFVLLDNKLSYSDGIPSGYAGTENFLLVSCAVSGAIVLCTIFRLIYNIRDASNTFTAIKLQTSACIVVLNILFMLGIQLSAYQQYHVIISWLLHSFFLPAMALQLSVVIIVFIECRSFLPGINLIYMPLLIGWGIPFLVTGNTFLIEYMYGDFVKRSWWLQFQHTDFYIFVFALLLLLIIQSGFSVALKQNLNIVPTVENQNIANAFKVKLLAVRHSWYILLSLTFHAVTSISLVNCKMMFIEYLFSSSNLVLGLTVAISYVSWKRKDSSVLEERLSFHCHTESAATASTVATAEL